MGGGMTNLERVNWAWEHWTREPVSLERYERGDLEPMFTDFYADDLRWDLTNFDPWPDAEVYVGEDQVREVYKLWFGTWAELHFTVESFDAPPDKVVSVVDQHGIGLESGAVVDVRIGVVWTLRDGRAARMDMHTHAEDAFAAAGITVPATVAR
jgi:ketosteroid isomerase-like protein